MNSKSGSTVIEAALIFPLIVLIAAGLISRGASMYAHVKEDSIDHRNKAIAEAAGLSIPTEAILRGRWVLE